VLDKLSGLSQIDLAKVDAYERKNQKRSTVLERTSALRDEEPWPGYDELNVSEVIACWARETRTAPSGPVPMSVRTRTGPASSTRPSAKHLTPNS
jgi:hypothetical protein